jgi:hypothetical protein
MTEVEEMRVEARKAGRRKFICIGAFFVFIILAVVLAILFIEKREIPSLLLCITAVVWCFILLSQFFITGKLLGALKTRIALIEYENPDEPETDELPVGDGSVEP